MKKKTHDCRDHIVIRHKLKQKAFTSGGPVTYTCSVCEQPVSMVMRSDQVLMRVRA